MNNKSKLQRDYEGLIPTIKWLSLAAQFISGSTAAFGIYVVILQKLPVSIKILAILITLILTFIVIASFEGGIRKIFPFWIRQILHWFFDAEKEERKPKSIRIVLFSMLCILLIPLVLGTTIASWKASPELVAYATPPPDLENLNAINSKIDETSNQILAQFEKDIIRDSINFQKRLSAEKSKWEALIDAQEIQRKKYKKLYSEGHQWANGSAAKIKNKVIPNLNSDMQKAFQSLHAKFDDQMDSLQSKKMSTLLFNQKNKTTVLTASDTTNQSLLQKLNFDIDKWGGFLAVLAIVATFFTLFCFTFIEAYKAGVFKNPHENDDEETAHTVVLNGNEKTHRSGENLQKSFVPQDTQKTPKHTAQIHQIDFVSLDNLIKRTRQQWKRANDESKSLESRETNRRKALENIEFLRSIGVGVRKDNLDSGKLMVQRRGIA